MGCLSRDLEGDVEETAKWDFINLQDFHPGSSFTPIAYLWLWILAIIGVVGFGADIFTAVNLLAFDRWSSQVQPALPLKYSKWIYTACIIIGFILYGYEWQRAIRVIKRGGVAESYMDPLAVRLQSMRGKGWKRFLVFTELTNNRKGADYVALFVYFQFKEAVRIIFAQGGRQVVNALTLWSVMQADFIPVGDHAAPIGQSPVLQFFSNVAALYNQDKEQAIVLLTMLFTLVLFVFSAVSLILAVILYITFIWHYIPSEYGRLSTYCRRKIDKRLEKIVEKWVKAALVEQEKSRMRALAKAERKAGKDMGMKKQPTYSDLEKEGSGIVRQGTLTSSGSFTTVSSRPTPPAQDLHRQPTLPDISLDERPEMGSRLNSQASCSSNSPLLRHADDMGHNSRPTSPEDWSPVMRQMSSSTNSSYRPQAPTRSATGSSQGSQRSNGRLGQGPGSRFPVRTNTSHSTDSADRNPMSRAGSAMGHQSNPYGPPRRANTSDTLGSMASSGTHSSQRRAFTPIAEQPSQEATPVSSMYSFSTTAPSQQTRQLSRTSFNRPFITEDRPGSALKRNPTLADSIMGMRSMSTSPPSIAGGNHSSSGSSSGEKGYTAFNPGLTRAPTAPPATAQPPARLASQTPYLDDHSFRQVQRSHTMPLPPLPTESSGYGDVLDGY